MLDGTRTVSCVACGLLALCLTTGQPGVSQALSNAAVAGAKPESKLPAFDVVSVKENRSDTGNISFNADSSGINITGAPLTNLLREAYGLYYGTDAQITRLTGWAKSERFDIKAKVAEADLAQFRKLTREQSGALLKAILADRFQLVAHTETREMPVYALVVAKHGAKLTPTNPDVPSPEGYKTSGCHAGCMSWDRRHLDAKGVGTEAVAGFLTQQTQRTVVDRSGLTGKYDFALDWAPMMRVRAAGLRPRPRRNS